MTDPTVRLFKTRQGQWVYDLGQNFSGIIRLSLHSKDTHPVKLYPAELLNPDSTVNQSASGAPFWFGYTPKGKGFESWQPQFTYYGFRYVQVEGAVPAGQPNPDELPEIMEITGLHTCNSAENVGSFHCSKPLFNQTYELIDWAIRSNMASVLTDCPHREKLGWLEEAHLMQYSVQYRYNLARLYEKTFNDMRSTQAANGMIPTIGLPNWSNSKEASRIRQNGEAHLSSALGTFTNGMAIRAQSKPIIRICNATSTTFPRKPITTSSLTV